jgi:hypothetical protein
VALSKWSRDTGSRRPGDHPKNRKNAEWAEAAKLRAPEAAAGERALEKQT